MSIPSVRRVVALAVITAFAGGLVLPALSARHASPDAEDRRATSARTMLLVSEAGPVEADEHCPVCHWLRAISGAFALAPVVVSATPAVEVLRLTPTADRRGRSEVPAVPSRAPPARVRVATL
jgi:hypothetical protein